MKLICKGTKVIGRLLNIELAEAETDNPFPIRMDEHGAYLHKHRGNKAFMTALENLELFTKVDGKPIREVWLTTLTDRLAVASTP
jgi:ABC-type transport system involved in cytochrome c biogenesis ATPase subunit